MRIVFLNGNEFRDSWSDFTHALWHPLFILLILAVTSIILILQPYDRFLPEGVMVRTLIIASAVIVFLACLLICAGQSRRLPFFVSTVSIITFCVFITSAWGVGISKVAGGQILGLAEWAQLLAFNMVLCIIAEIFLASFLLERIVKETGLKAHPFIAFAQTDAALPHAPMPATKELATPTPAWREILGQRLEVDAIWHLKAEEHYVAVKLQDGRSLLLARAACRRD
jgi:hypothetical protein